MTPTARTLAESRKRGWLAQVVERWLPHARRRIDYLGCIDILALDGLPGVLGIQTTSDNTGGAASKRVSKIQDECNAAARRWLEAGNRLEVWTWAKQGPRGKRKLWTLRIVPITVEMLGPPTVCQCHSPCEASR
jgi:hypothetical protein